MQHGTVDVSAEGIEGYQVWELYEKRWQKSQDEKHHVCAVVQQVEGELVSDLDGCLACDAAYRITLTPLESDCDPAVADDPGLAGMTHYAFGEVDQDHAGSDPYPGRSVGWYVGWDGESAELMGFAFDEELEHVDGQPQSGWGPGARYVLDPAYAWEL
ncbi:MAG: hypothetical protein H6742_04450 [Alphaproteobacteria bacterium]|nr:hypothetical protein [Alphaproteobacteria bacterium]